MHSQPGLAIHTQASILYSKCNNIYLLKTCRFRGLFIVGLAKTKIVPLKTVCGI